MKMIVFILLIFCSCTGTQQIARVNHPTNTEQVFLADKSQSLPGKCYQRTKLNGDLVWTEIICHNQVTKNLIKQVQTDLRNLGFGIDAQEIEQGKMGETTKKALNDFQVQSGMSLGGFDWATVNRIKSQL